MKSNLRPYEKTFPIGSQWSEWTVIGPPIVRGRNTRVRARCSCGNVRTVLVYSLHSGHSRRCNHHNGAGPVTPESRRLEAERSIAVEPEVPESELLPMPERPRTRGDCIDGPRPCPWATCRYSLLPHWANEDGETPIDVLRHTCALDVADRAEGYIKDNVTPGDPGSLNAIAQVTNLTRERVRQVETIAVSKLLRGLKRAGIDGAHTIIPLNRGKYSNSQE